MRRITALAVCVLALASAPALAEPPFAPAALGACESLTVGAPLSVPIFGRPAPESDARETAGRHVPDDRRKAVKSYPGVNVTAASLRLESDWDTERGYRVVGVVTNTGTIAVPGFACRFYLGDPDSGGAQIGGDVHVSSLRPNRVEVVEVPWVGFTGADVLHFVVDAEDSVVEKKEDDNVDTLAVVLRDDVPWVWQEINGYCNYASLAMLFNHRGAGNTVCDAVELAACPYSMFAVDDKFAVGSGILASQGESDYVLAGDIRNLDCEFGIAAGWPHYLFQLRSRLDAGLPFLTGVDPYYLPQPDYDWLEVYGLHSAHAVVVTGYTDSSVIVNDPGIGLPEYPEPMPSPEFRGADVVVDLDAFRLCVEQTIGMPFVLVSYAPDGPMPSVGEMFDNVLNWDAARLDGDPSAYAEIASAPWPPGWTPHFGAPSLAVLAADMDQATFTARFEEIASSTGYDLGATLDRLALDFANGLLWQAISWDASRVFFEEHPFVGAEELSSLSGSLAGLGNSAFESAVEMLTAIADAGGNPTVAGPHLTDIQADLAAMTDLEASVRDALTAMRASGSPQWTASEPEPEPEAGERRLVAHPNPFGVSTEIHFSGARPDAPRIAVYDVSGRLVRRLEGASARGSVTWDGADASGGRTAPGIYFARDSAGRTAKLVKLR